MGADVTGPAPAKTKHQQVELNTKVLLTYEGERRGARQEALEVPARANPTLGVSCVHRRVEGALARPLIAARRP